MKHFIGLLTLIGLLSFSCNSSQGGSSRRNMTELNTMNKDHVFTVGDKAYYSADVHGSVGFTATASSSPDEVIKFLDTDFKYDDPKKSKMSGGDGGTKFFIFEAVGPGEGSITIEKGYRGEVQSTTEITVKVKAKI